MIVLECREIDSSLSYQNCTYLKQIFGILFCIQILKYMYGNQTANDELQKKNLLNKKKWHTLDEIRNAADKIQNV